MIYLGKLIHYFGSVRGEIVLFEG